MFRRKEEGLFDTDMDQNENQNQDMQEEKSISQPSSVSFGSSSSSQNSGSSVTSQQSAQRQSSAAPTASSFRPATAQAPAQAPDMNRNRQQEQKQPAASVTSSFSNPLPMADKNKAGKRVLTVGNDILLKGEIATCDRLVIEGKVDATLNDVHTVEIAECGSFKGAAQIEDAEISGLFEGELIVRGRLIIYATGKVRGKISYGEIEIERGGELTGEIKITGAGNNSRPAPRNNMHKDDKVAA